MTKNPSPDAAEIHWVQQAVLPNGLEVGGLSYGNVAYRGGTLHFATGYQRFELTLDDLHAGKAKV